MTNNATKFDNQVTTSIVQTSEDLADAFFVRAICYMEERGVPARQTFDGNDYQATHFITRVGEEPVGTLRIRWFNGFVKLERTCFRKDYRGPRILQQCAPFIWDHIARKGFDTVITHAQPKYARIWRTVLGFESVEGKEPVTFIGHEDSYVELVKKLDPHPHVINRDTDPTILFRVEGEWDRPDRMEAI